MVNEKCPLVKYLNTVKSAFLMLGDFIMLMQKEKKNMHNCGIQYCDVCERNRPLMCNCFLSCNIGKKDVFYTRNCDEKMNIYVFDFETEANPSNVGIFKPYYGCVYKFCNICMDDCYRKMEYLCCGMNDWICFEGKDTDDLFGQYFLDVANGDVKSRWFAHNGSRFDTLFLLRFLVCKKNLIPKVIMNGLRIMKLSYKNTEVLDSMLLCPSSLKKVVKMLDLGDNVKKGYYPYDFTDLNYNGPIPDKSHFPISKMNEEELKEFEIWYEEKRKLNYVLRTEVKEYCMNDVDVLVKSLVKFHEIIRKHTSIEVLFDQGIITISSLALKTFMKMSNLKDLLGVEPSGGYNCGKTLKKQSKIAIMWLNEINKQIGDPSKFRWIYHVLGEKKIEHFYVDGYDEVNDVIYEFLGCYYHGCSDCFDLNSFNFKCKKTFGKLNSEKSSRLNHLKMRCSNLIVMKECKYLKTIKGKNMGKFLKKSPIKIRDSLYGGRTSPSVLYKDCMDRGKIHYVDFVSLYPSIQFEKYFPVGEHNVVIDNEIIIDFIEKEMKKKTRTKNVWVYQM